MPTLPLHTEPARPVIPFNVFVWKIASRCNLNCTYCYVYNRGDQTWRTQPAFMSEAVARQTAARIREQCRAHGKREVVIVLHGGEPLLGGVDHLRRLLTAVKEELTGSGIEFRVRMQTNGLLFTEAIGDLLLEFGAHIGVSLDGPPDVNDRYRVDHAGRPVSAQLEERLELLRSPRYRPLFGGFLCVIDPETDPVRVTDYLLSFEPPGLDYLLPHHNWVNPPPGKRHDPQATPYGDWLARAFDRWLARRSTARIRLFDAIIRTLCGTPSGVESLGTGAVSLVVVEADGTLEAVDALKSTYHGATRLGYNVFDHDLDTVAADGRIQARQLHARGLCRQCRECSLVEVCGGGYLPHRYGGGDDFANPSVYCSDLIKIITHIRRRLVEELRKAQPEGAAAAPEPAGMAWRLRPGARPGGGRRMQASWFDLSAEAETALGLRRACEYALLRDRLRAAAPADGGGAGPDAGWLGAVSLADLVRHGTPFFWRNVRRCHTACAGGAPALSVALRYLLMTGFDAYFPLLPDGASCALPAGDDGPIVLPRLGVRLATPGGPARLSRVHRGAVRVEDAGGRETTVPLDAVPPGARLPWRPVGDSARLLLDRHPALLQDADVAGITADLPDAAAHAAHIGAALDLIRTADPRRAERIAARVRWYVPLAPLGPGMHRSGTTRNLGGVIFLAETANTVQLAEAVVHEYYHDVLNARMELEELLAGGGDRRFYSPWRDDARPITGLLHALYVFSGVAEFFRRAEQAPGLNGQREPLRERRRLVVGRLRLGYAQVPPELFTPRGRELLAALKEVIDRHDAELGVSRGPLPAELAAHLRRWCAAHPDLAPRVRLN